MQDLMKPLVLPVVLEVQPGKQALLVLPLLLVDCSGRAEALVVVALVALVAQVVQVVAALVAVVAVVVAAHPQQVLAGLVALAGHWFWSFDHAAICRG